MRHQRGYKWTKLWMNGASNRNFKIINRLPLYNSQMKSEINQNLNYIGRCRCGYGPNAFYKTSNGDVIHASQLLKKRPIEQAHKGNMSTPELSQKTLPPKIEIYRICNNCGARIRDDAYFCTECGNVVGEPSSFIKKEQIQVLKNRIKELKSQIKFLKKNEF